MLSSVLIENIEKELTELSDEEVYVVNTNTIGGGSINNAYELTTNQGSFFVKVNSASAFPGMFDAEKKGLELLRSNCNLHIPQVHLNGEFDEHAYLLMEFTSSAGRSPTFWDEFGSGLAVMHQQFGEQFGLDHDNYIGSLPQNNTQGYNWAEFFITMRLEPMIRVGNTDREINRRFERLFGKLDNIFPHEPPSLLHGDLWSGNFSDDAKGLPTIFDPAVYYGHREMDIAMSKLFGGFDWEFYQAYNENYPMESDWENRVDIANLYPLMVHVNLFGGSYLNSVRQILKPFA